MHHVYLHVPFCARRCSYCDFSIAVRRVVPSERYVRAVLAERDLRGEREGWGSGSLETLYLGGGTPSRLSADAVTALVGAFRLDAGAEVTLEANPDDVTPAAARAWHEAGVTRVSLGVQSFDDEVLRWMHRTHDAAQARAAVATLHEAGIGEISLDLIFGLPGDLARDFARDLEAALALEPDHLSVYGLSVEPRTPLARWVDRGATRPAPDERYAEEFLLAHARLTAAGFEHYEISNYARPGRRARHNSAYWSGAAYVGLGPAAHGFDGMSRRWNVAQWAMYERRLAAGEDPLEDVERLTDRARALESLYLGLRTAEGAVTAGRGDLVPAAVERAVSAGWLESKGDRLVATPDGWLRLDAVLPALTT